MGAMVPPTAAAAATADPEMEPNSVSKGDDRDGLLVGGGEV